MPQLYKEVNFCKSMINLVTFDWNGTLLADTQACMDAGNHVIETFGGRPLPRNVYSKVFDFPTLEFYCNQGADRDALLANDFAGVFHEYYEPRASKCHTRRGARKVLSWLDDKSIDSVILSNHIKGAIIQQLQRLSMEEYFAEVLANEDTKSTASGKNKIERMINYMESIDINPRNAVIIGDSPEDIGIGKELGMRTIAITDGYYSTSRLRASRPDDVVSSLIKVIPILKKY